MQASPRFPAEPEGAASVATKGMTPKLQRGAVDARSARRRIRALPFGPLARGVP